MGFYFNVDSITPSKGSGGGGQTINNEDMTITSNGIYTASGGYTGIGTATVNVPAGSDQKYGATINNFLGDVDSNGVLQFPSGYVDLTFTGVKDLAYQALAYKFYAYQTDYVRSVSFPDLTAISGQNSLSYCFFSNTRLTSFSADNVMTMSGSGAMERCFQQCYSLETFSMKNLKSIPQNGLNSVCNNCRKLTSIDLRSVETIDQSGLMGAFYNCYLLSSVNLSSLKSVSGNALSNTFYACRELTSFSFDSLEEMTGFYVMNGAFAYCTGLTSVSFPALKSASFATNTYQFYNMLQGVTGCTVHFPSNLQSVIGSWTDVTNGFGGTNTTVLFDLPATE